jgi:hypothetical protein
LSENRRRRRKNTIKIVKIFFLIKIARPVFKNSKKGALFRLKSKKTMKLDD